jgi:hypothetical protein
MADCPQRAGRWAEYELDTNWTNLMEITGGFGRPFALKERFA